MAKTILDYFMHFGGSVITTLHLMTFNLRLVLFSRRSGALYANWLFSRPSGGPPISRLFSRRLFALDAYCNTWATRPNVLSFIDLCFADFYCDFITVLCM